MKEITVKNYLRGIKKMEAMIQKKQLELVELDSQRKNITAQMGGERVQTSPQLDKMAELSAKILDLQNEIILDISKKLDEKYERIRIIEQVEEEREYMLLHIVYIEYQLLKVAAVEIGVDYESAKKIHGRALEYIRKNVAAPDGYKFIPKKKRCH